jgi:hypothetical protein
VNNPIIITKFGEGENPATEIMISRFENGADANNYCSVWKNVDLGDNKWAQSIWIDDNFVKISLKRDKEIDYKLLLISLDNASIQKVLRQIGTHELCCILVGEDDEVQSKIFSNMSKRAAEMLRDDIDHMGPITVQMKKAATLDFIRSCERLESYGEISISDSARK